MDAAWLFADCHTLAVDDEIARVATEASSPDIVPGSAFCVDWQAVASTVIELRAARSAVVVDVACEAVGRALCVARKAPDHKEIEGWSASETVSVCLIEGKAFFGDQLTGKVIRIKDVSRFAD